MEFILSLILTALAEVAYQEEEPAPPSQPTLYQKKVELMELFEQLDKDTDKKIKPPQKEIFK